MHGNLSSYFDGASCLYLCCTCSVGPRGVASFGQIMAKGVLFSLECVWPTYAYINSCTLNSQKGGFFRTPRTPLAMPLVTCSSSMNEGERNYHRARSDQPGSSHTSSIAPYTLTYSRFMPKSDKSSACHALSAPFLTRGMKLVEISYTSQ